MSKYQFYWVFIIFVSLGVLGLPPCLYAAPIFIAVREASGEWVENVLVYVKPLSEAVKKAETPGAIIVDQIDKEFIKPLTIVQLGTEVHFPNHDKIRHHVYSFSSAKKFEIPLYEGMPPNPIVFDKEGVVVLGCNIHDWMHAYIYVIDTPYFTTTGRDGQALLDLPLGNYAVRVWHPRLKESASQTSQELRVNEEKRMDALFTIALMRGWNPRRGPITRPFSRGEYR